MAFIKKRLNSFVYAFTGINTFIRSQTHPKIHLTAAIIVVMAGFYFEVSVSEWIALIIIMTIVFVAEALNTALELLCDKISPEKNHVIKNIKDISAGAVLIAALSSLIIGALIFLPKISEYFSW